MGKSLKNRAAEENFLNSTPTAQALRSIDGKGDLLNLKNIFKAKDTVNRTKRQTTDWAKILTKSTSY